MNSIYLQYHDLLEIRTIRSLVLSNCKRIGSDGILPLKNLPKLLSLDLSSTNIDNDALSVIKEMPRIEILNISGVRNISDQGLVHLSACTTLTKLIAKSTPFTDDSLVFTSNYIKNLNKRAGFLSLHTLILSDTLVTDQCLPYCLDLPTVAHIDFSNTQCTASALERLCNQFKLQQGVQESTHKSLKINIQRQNQSLREPDLVIGNNQRWPIDRIKQYLHSLNVPTLENHSLLNTSNISTDDESNSSFEIDSSLYLPPQVDDSSRPSNGILGINLFKDPFSTSPTKRSPGMVGWMHLSLASSPSSSSLSAPPTPSINSPTKNTQKANDTNLFITPIKREPTKHQQQQQQQKTPLNNYLYQLLRSPKRTPNIASPIISPKSNKKRFQYGQYELLSPTKTNAGRSYPTSPAKMSDGRSTKRSKQHQTIDDQDNVVKKLFVEC
ncbi:hypothetical protein SAMD00019534_027700 [Acytostelium subglobosum LB1]|uniref:hypothetical protein n=1 Tax=Acytostelium subglobosum LB1 TaxID=1410327 RepID=UPI0006450475|nr:hypothetical protein SAMD00019534_027700 [Acytostelium subglobosum LB1]GAM19595.1 hypothetical protein SAMD00019534_027700 [Acytostelium subglobosum LB1]|eukprot:XP_012756357.1 hypothetical protein SAMD00019534_027700 [Acytostelium subglobosum LB1]